MIRNWNSLCNEISLFFMAYDVVILNMDDIFQMENGESF